MLFYSPPLLAVTDATIISKYTDKMVLIIMPGKTEKKALSHCTNTLKNMNSALSGIVFNGVDSKNSYGSYYYYYQYYYYYYYYLFYFFLCISPNFRATIFFY